ncbi:hypothetical protein [Roseovarius amoyensis]|uniref:hypothetical protein n=1 Tax=Roseovarius amoyensis TaxID=2211448 RepID=UPI000DBE8435|nr:hypothetical protein [Roseovarius amoyensis]
MTTDTEADDPVERALVAIREHIKSVEAERDRLSNIAATIRVNAMRRGATDEQIDDFLNGRQSFIEWMVGTLEAERDTAWNDAIEAAAAVLEREAQDEMSSMSCGDCNDMRRSIRARADVLKAAAGTVRTIRALRK